MTEERKKILNEVAIYIANFKCDHPIRVAIDGVDTSGKTTLADELVNSLEAIGRSVIRASIDKFHNPREKRYKKGENSPEGYYYDSFNTDFLIKNLLQPLGEKGSLIYQDALFDFKTDSEVESKLKKTTHNAILLFDGVFLFRPELSPYWDIKIFLDVPFVEVLNRAKIRDRELLGSELEEKYQKRYIPGQKLYLESVQPKQKADIVIDNSDVNYPTISHKIGSDVV